MVFLVTFEAWQPIVTIHFHYMKKENHEHPVYYLYATSSETIWIWNNMRIFRWTVTLSPSLIPISGCNFHIQGLCPSYSLPKQTSNEDCPHNLSWRLMAMHVLLVLAMWPLVFKNSNTDLQTKLSQCPCRIIAHSSVMLLPSYQTLWLPSHKHFGFKTWEAGKTPKHPKTQLVLNRMNINADFVF